MSPTQHARLLLTMLVAAVAAGALTGAAHANGSTWTEIASGTTEDITAIEYQGPNRFWWATGAGTIFRRVDGVVTLVATSPVATTFKDIEFQDGGPVGFAVGTNGVVMRSANSGQTWSRVTGIVGGKPRSDVNWAGNCAGPHAAIGNVDSVRFTGNSRAWLIGSGSQIYRATNVNANLVGNMGSSWVFINEKGDGGCKISGINERDIDDIFSSPTPTHDSVYFISKYSGRIHFSSDALENSDTALMGSVINDHTATKRMAGDPANPNRQWAIASGGQGFQSYARTTDGWDHSEEGWRWRKFGCDDSALLTIKPEDVDYNGGTVMIAGAAGMILKSTDNLDFYCEHADGTLETHNWKAVSLASGADAAIGGINGKLIVSSDANAIPDVFAPTGTIAGPPTAVAGVPVTFTANVTDNAGGSGVDPAGYRWSVPGQAEQTGPSATFTFPDSGSRTITLTFRDLAGNAGTATARVSVSVTRAAAPPPPPVLPRVTPAVTPRAVAVTGLRFAPIAFRAARFGATVRPTAVRSGTRVSYTLNIPASVRFTVERVTTGRRVGSRCVMQTGRNRSRRACTRYTRVGGSFTRVRTRAGIDRFTFTGRIGGRALRTGRYRLVATPTANRRSGQPKRASFRIMRNR